MTDQVVASPRSTPRAPRGLPEWGLGLLRPFVRAYLRRRWDIHARGEHKVPTEGPVIFASNHIGWLDGPLLILCAPRPAHALVKKEAFEGKTGRLLRLTGQIRLDRQHRDIGALRTSADALAAGQTVVVYPEGFRGSGEVTQIKHGVAWLALVTGAPIVPVAIFGTRGPGQPADAKPAKRARIDVVYGEPLRVPAVAWPRNTHLVAEVGRQVHDHLRRHVAWAAETGNLQLPGPLPQGSSDA